MDDRASDQIRGVRFYVIVTPQDHVLLETTHYSAKNVVLNFEKKNGVGSWARAAAEGYTIFKMNASGRHALNQRTAPSDRLEA